jgi:dihydroorotate dehydrogenase electron transfer subunit
MTRFVHQSTPVLENIRLARDTYRIRLHAPELAAAILPGQFVMLRLPNTNDPLLGRPFALYDTALDADSRPISLDIVYLVVGKQTSRLASLGSGDTLEVWGPLGNGFPSRGPMQHIGLVAGGIGQTPFLAYIRQLTGARGYGGRPARRSVQRASLYYGARTADLLAGVDDFRSAGAEVYLATDDGSAGFGGFVTQLLEKNERPEHLVGCGPELMMRALAGLARLWQVPCDLSLETPMACGVGICFSCVTPVQTESGWDYRRVCIDGPVFDAAKLAWDV